MTAWDAAVAADVQRIEIRAMTLYSLKNHHGIAWDYASSDTRDRYRAKAAKELWDENELLLDPSIPYYETEAG